MMNKPSVRKLVRTFVGLSVPGVLLGSGCNVGELQAIAVGLEAVVQQLSGNDSHDDNDVNFGDWLLMELTD